MKRGNFISSKIAYLVIILALIVGIKSAYIQQTEENIKQDTEELSLTSMPICSDNVSENAGDAVEVNKSDIDTKATTQEASRGGGKKIPMELPSQTDGSFKTYMDYRCITDKSSAQWRLQQQAYTDKNGFRRVYDDYCVALGTYYTQTIGERFYIKLDSGIEFTVIVSDIKSNIHTDLSNRFIEHNGNLCEFIIDTNQMDNLAIKMGDVSYAGLSGKIASIERMIK